MQAGWQHTSVQVGPRQGYWHQTCLVADTDINIKCNHKCGVSSQDGWHTSPLARSFRHRGVLLVPQLPHTVPVPAPAPGAA